MTMIWFAGRVPGVLRPFFWNALVLQFHGKLQCPGFLWRMCVWFRYRGLKGQTGRRIYECLNKCNDAS